MVPQNIYFSTGIILWIAAAIIFIRRPERAFYFVAAYLLIMGFGIITRSLTSSGQLVSYPHLYQIISPLHFLYGPLYFYFLITFFRSRYQFNLKDALHLIPFFINLIDYIPFYVASAEHKIMMIQTGSDVSTFGIPVMYYNLLKSVSFVVYFLLVGWFYLQFIYNTRFSEPRMTRLIHFWLRTDYLLKLLALVSYIGLVFIGKQYAFAPAFYLFSLDSLINVYIIFRYPSLLEGVRMEYNQGTWIQTRGFSAMMLQRLFIWLKSKPSKADIEANLHYIIVVKQVYLDHQFNSVQFAKKLNVSESQLEAFIQSTYDCSCDDFIHFKRLQYLLEKSAPQADWAEQPLFKTLFKSGFNSVTSLQFTLSRYHALPSVPSFQFDKELLLQINVKLSEMLTRE